VQVADILLPRRRRKQLHDTCEFPGNLRFVLGELLQYSLQAGQPYDARPLTEWPAAESRTGQIHGGIVFPVMRAAAR
jgi:hypothetical protein